MTKPRSEPAALGSSRDVQKLVAYYREHGESAHVAELEAALTDDWQTTQQLAEAAGKSPQWARRALEYLALEQRADRDTQPLDRPVKGITYRLVWRRPTSPVPTT